MLIPLKNTALLVLFVSTFTVLMYNDYIELSVLDSFLIALVAILIILSCMYS